MEKYDSLEFEIIEFDENDIITESSGDTHLPIIWN